MFIFSYGSNMLTARLEARIGEFEILGKGFVRGYDLRFHKRSKDGSGKADVFFTGNEKDTIWGIVSRITPNQKSVLDKFEGLGYGYIDRELEVNLNRVNIQTIAYMAENEYIDSSLKPYVWYKAFVLKAAIEYDFPEEYIEKIKSIEAVIDLNEERRNKNLGILNS